MKHKKTKPFIIIALIIVGIHILLFASINLNDTYFEGTVTHFSLTDLSLVQTGSNMDCDVFNQISVTHSDNSYKTLASGRQGLTPFIDSSVPLDIFDGSKEVKTIHFELALLCDGKAMAGATVVTGTNKIRICGNPSYAGTTCINGQETPFSTFDTKTLGNTAIQDDILKVVHSVDFSKAVLNNVYNTGTGSIHFKFESFPILTFNFIHPSIGSFSGSYNSQIEDQKITAQYGTLTNTQTSSTPDPDPVQEVVTQGTSGKALRINFWLPQMLDLSLGETNITVSTGIENLDNTEVQPTIKVVSLSGFVKQEFIISNGCASAQIGFKDCETIISLDETKYAPGSYKIQLSSDSRPGTIVSVPIEIIDPSSNITTSTADNTDPASEFVNFITGGGTTTTTTSSGVSITRSTESFDFGTDDIVIIMILISVVAGFVFITKVIKKK